MDSADYVELALRLANTDLGEVADLRAALHDQPWWADRLTEADLRALRPAAAGVRRALDAAIRDDGDSVLAEVNALLAAHPLRPRLSGHGSTGTPDWHIHVAAQDAPPATEVAAAACWGLAQGVVRHGLTRWGSCDAADCANFYLDTSTNRVKRFCSPRCANRVHVAAHRARTRQP